MAGEVVLGEDVFAGHAAGIADIQLVGPVAGIGEFIFGQAPTACFGADGLWHDWVIGQEIEEAVGPAAVFLPDLKAAGGRGFDVGEAGAGEVGGDAAAGIDVGFVIGHGGDAEEVVEAG